ncbi:MAG: hypothetical protein IKS41_00355 [Alphaproteobacteria bacterium]|nr:hypothetical protein [Alphaproteobacteria bacterium]
MKILIIGPLGAGKSSLAYKIQKQFKISRLNIDEVCRNPKDGSYYPRDRQFSVLKTFTEKNKSWVAEGCQSYLYKKMKPDIIIDMRIHWIIAMKRYVIRFLKAKRLIGKNVDKDLPIQAYHYRKITLQKIREYNRANREINQEIGAFLKTQKVPVIACSGYRDYAAVLSVLKGMKQ